MTSMGPVAMFLGESSAAGGPFVLLSLPVARVDEQTITAALELRLATVNSHPHASTPAADEVRLALYAAAAQLGDPTTCDHLISQWTHIQKQRKAPQHPKPTTPTSIRANIKQPSQRCPVQVRTASRRPHLTPGQIDSHDVMLAIGLSGGWNHRFLRSISMIAHARGIDSATLAESLRNFSTNISDPSTQRLTPAPTVNGSSAAGQQAITSKVSPASLQPLPPQVKGKRDWFDFVILGGLITLFLLVALIFKNDKLSQMIQSPRPPDQSPVTDNPQSDNSSLSSTTDNSDAQPAHDAGATAGESDLNSTDSIPADARDLTKSFHDALEGLEISPEESIQRFEQSIRVLSSAWVSFAPDQLLVVHNAIIDYLYAIGSDRDLTQRAADALTQLALVLAEDEPLDQQSISSSAWSAGIIARLSRERNLPALLDRRLVDARGSLSGFTNATFEQGILWILARVPSHLLKHTSPDSDAINEQAWDAWLDMINDLTLIDAARRDDLLLLGLDKLLRQGPDPLKDRSANNLLVRLVLSLTWRNDDPARNRLLQWIMDRDISPRAINALTAALVTRSSAPNLSPDMVLRSNASAADRQALRQQYAQAWNIQSLIDKDQVVQSLLEIAQEQLDDSPLPSTTVEQMASAIRISRISQAAGLWWNGDPENAQSVLEHLLDPIQQAFDDSAIYGDRGTLTTGTGQWGEKYLNAKSNIPVRDQLLSELQLNGGPKGTIDAEVLVREACFGSPHDIKTKAQDLVEANRDNPAVVNGLLEYAPRIPPLTRLSVMIENVTARDLPSVDHKAWRPIARRALVQRLLELLADQQNLGLIDRFSTILAQSYMTRVSGFISDSDSVLTDPPSLWAAELVQNLRLTAEAFVGSPAIGLTLAQINQQGTGRLRLAQGPVQVFAAHQVHATYLLAYIVASEQPESTPQVSAILQQLATNRRAASNIIQQVDLAERVMLRLWLMRITKANLG